MEALLGERRQTGGPALRGRLVAGDPTDAILDAAREGYDLVVMSTHGRSGLERVLIGSVAEKVVRQAVCPVLTVRRRAAGARAA